MDKTRQNRCKEFSRISTDTWTAKKTQTLFRKTIGTLGQRKENADTFPKNPVDAWTEQGRETQTLFQKTIGTIGRAKQGWTIHLLRTRVWTFINPSLLVLYTFLQVTRPPVHTLYIYKGIPRGGEREYSGYPTMGNRLAHVDTWTLTHTRTRRNQHD